MMVSVLRSLDSTKAVSAGEGPALVVLPMWQPEPFQVTLRILTSLFDGVSSPPDGAPESGLASAALAQRVRSLRKCILVCSGGGEGRVVASKDGGIRRGFYVQRPIVAAMGF